MTDRINYVGQIFGSRKIIKNECVDNDWTSIGMKVPKEKSKYRLGKCMVCGKESPILIAKLLVNPPKRCSWCSNIGHRSSINADTNSWTVYDDVAVCNILYHGSIVQCFIDANDYERVAKNMWRISKKKNKYYAITGSGKEQIYLHKYILDNTDVEEGFEIDHIDGNSMNNRKNNLRVVSRLENIQNSKARIDNVIGIRGISHDGKCYHVDFSFNNTRFYFRQFKTIEEAVLCRKVAEEVFGLSIIGNNPLAPQYDTLDEEAKKSVTRYTIDIISNTVNSGKPPVVKTSSQQGLIPKIDLENLPLASGMSMLR